MQKRAITGFTGLAALAFLAFSAPGFAQEPARDSARVRVDAADVPVQPERPAAVPALFGGTPLDDFALAQRRGGAGISDMKLDGVVAENQAVNIGLTGNNVISQGAFANSAGVPMIVQNSGNNVLIQNATIVNVEVK